VYFAWFNEVLHHDLVICAHCNRWTKALSSITTGDSVGYIFNFTLLYYMLGLKYEKQTVYIIILSGSGFPALMIDTTNRMRKA